MVKTNDYILMQNLQSLFGKTGAEDIQEYLRDLDSRLSVQPPFRFGDLRIIYQKFQVLNEVYFARRNSQMVKLMEETEDSPALITDALIPGKDGLFVVMFNHDIEVAQSWLRAATTPCMVYGTRPEFGLMTFPLKAFA